MVHHASNPGQTKHLGSHEKQTSVQPARIPHQFTTSNTPRFTRIGRLFNQHEYQTSTLEVSHMFIVARTRIVLDTGLALKMQNSLVNEFTPLLHGRCVFLLQLQYCEHRNTFLKCSCSVRKLRTEGAQSNIEDVAQNPLQPPAGRSTWSLLLSHCLKATTNNFVGSQRVSHPAALSPTYFSRWTSHWET